MLDVDRGRAIPVRLQPVGRAADGVALEVVLDEKLDYIFSMSGSTRRLVGERLIRGEGHALLDSERAQRFDRELGDLADLPAKPRELRRP